MGVSGGRLTAGGGEVAGRACPAPTGGERKIVGRPALRPPRRGQDPSLRCRGETGCVKQLRAAVESARAGHARPLRGG